MSKPSKMKSAKSLRKPPPLASMQSSKDAITINAAFELELHWCVQQLEVALNSGKLSQKVAEDTAKNIKVLKSSTAPIVKKRQVMKASLGDYRSKMKDEEKRMALSSRQIKFTNKTDGKSSFVKKSAILTSGKDFRFNFETPASITEEHTKDETVQTQSILINKHFGLSTGGNFKFNFQVDEENENLNFSELSIKN